MVDARLLMYSAIAVSAYSGIGASPSKRGSRASSARGLAAGPIRSILSSLRRWPNSVPTILTREERAPGFSPAENAPLMRNSACSSASASISTSASRCWNTGSAARLLSRQGIWLAWCRIFPSCFFTSMVKLWPPRSNSRRNLATDQPSFSAPTRLSTGTRTSSKNTWHCSTWPSRLTISLTVIPGVSSSTSRKLMPAWGFTSLLVRTRQKIWLA